MNRRLALGWLVAALGVGGLGNAGCKNREVHPFSAWAYDPMRKCLETPAVVDVLAGPDDGPCKEVRCWESSAHNIYVTNTACDAPSDYKNETNETSGACHAALELFGSADHGQCADGGGGSGGAPLVSSETP